MNKNIIELNEYEELESRIYETKKKRNIIEKIFHSRRFHIAKELVRKYYIDGDIILDVCCGFCDWNEDKLPVIGMDISNKSLNIAIKSGRISKKIKTDVLKNKLKDNYADIIICTGTFEHFKYPNELMKEVNRLLKPNGIIIISVPYESYVGLWRPLIGIKCFIEGTIKKRLYYVKKLGHINRFTPKTLIPLVANGGFKVLELINNMTMDFFIVAKKDE